MGGVRGQRLKDRLERRDGDDVVDERGARRGDDPLCERLSL